MANDSDIPGFFAGTGMPDSVWWEALWPDPAAVISALGIRPGMDAIDLCAGDGWFTLPIAKVARKMFAIDIDGNLLETAKHRAAESRISNCLFIEGDAYKLAALVPEPVDYVFLANAFHGVPDKTGLSKDVRAALKPDGIFAIVNWYDRPREETVVLGEPRGPATELRMSPEATVASIQQSGLRLRYVVDVSPFHYGAVFSRSVEYDHGAGEHTSPAAGTIR